MDWTDRPLDRVKQYRAVLEESDEAEAQGNLWVAEELAEMAERLWQQLTPDERAASQRFVA